MATDRPADSAGARIVVVGATGNVGTSVVEALSDDPRVASVLGLARRLPQWTCPKTEWAAVDIARNGDVAELTEHFRGADAVIHLAWILSPTHNPVVTWRTNVLGSVRVFDAVAAAGVPALVHASSLGAYSPGPKDGRPVDESWPTHGWPDAAYCREKAYLERVLDTFERDHPGLRVARLRPAFIFKRESASEQRRLFAGPLLPSAIARPGSLPALPGLTGLRFQVLHAADAAEGYRLAALRPVSGPFNLAAEPVVDRQLLSEIMQARSVPVPTWPLRMALSAAWHLHLTPASPQLFDAVRRLPILDTTRARAELGWSPRFTAREALAEFLRGVHEGAGMATAPLAARADGRRRREAKAAASQHW